MKKKLISKLSVLIGLAAVLGFSSCLKDDRYVDFSKVGTLIELPLSAYTGLGKLTPRALPILTEAQTIPVVVNVASPKPLGQAVNVTVALDQASLDAFNAAALAKFLADSTAAAGAGTAIPAHPKTYVLPPAGSYTIVNPKVTVPAGQRTATVNVNVITSLLDPTGFYVIPVSITDASGQKISNYKTVLLNVQAKNKYDAVYDYKGYVLRLTDPVLTGNFSGLTTTASTLGATSVGFNQVWATGAQAGGINAIILTVDEATNKVTVTSQVNTTLANDPAYDNRYDPATKTFYVSFTWNAPGTRAATDTLTYKGPSK